jgi:endonuclease/exonuclease/phosphatase family metal-dependent hydrolase
VAHFVFFYGRWTIQPENPTHRLFDFLNRRTPMPDVVPPLSKSRWHRWVVRLAILDLAATVAVWIVFIAGADDDAWPTLLLFGPRWVVVLPTAVVLVLAVFFRSLRAGAIGLVALALALGPIVGGTVSIGAAFAKEPKSYRLRIVSLNCGGKLVKREAFDAFIAETKPDIVAVQEMPPAMEEWMKNWNSAHGGFSTAIFSKYSISPLPPLDEHAMGGLGGAVGAKIETPMVRVTFYSLHLITARDGLAAILAKKLNGLDDLRHTIRIRDEASRNTRAWVGDPELAIIAGDFNMPVESRIYRRDWGGFHNAYSDSGNGFGLTFHTSHHGVRIDHILFTNPWVAHRAWVGSDVGSDHWPEVADLTLESE